MIANVEFQNKESPYVDEGKLWGEMEEVPIEVDLGNRKESWTCEQRWGQERESTGHL